MESLDPTLYVTLEPPDSPLEDIVRDAANKAGLTFSRRRQPSPEKSNFDVEIPVLDLLSSSASVVEVGPATIVVDSFARECFHPPQVMMHAQAFDVLDPTELTRRLPRALRNLARTLLSARLQSAERDTVRTLNEIGLSAIRDIDRLSTEILKRACSVLRADGGTLYIVESGVLHFAAAQNDTIRFEAASFTLPIDDTSLAGYAAHHGRPLNIHDVYALPSGVSYRQNLDFDKQYGYCSKSMLLVPMKDRRLHSIGVLSLINHKQHAGRPLRDLNEVLPFSESDVDLALSIASQAAVALENHKLVREIRELFEGFIQTSVRVIEARDPPTGGHSHRVAVLTLALARAVHASTAPAFAEIHFSQEQFREIFYAGVLHDFGKVGVRESVLSKSSRLFEWEIALIESRFHTLRLILDMEASQSACEASLLASDLANLQRDLELIRSAVRTDPPPEALDLAQLRAIEARWRHVNPSQPLLSESDIAHLSLRSGTLDENERREVESHASHTLRFLEQIPWPEDLEKVPLIAAAHHEKLDGTGYPLALREHEIPYAARMMAICDIYDALTAVDRPYRKAYLRERALEILRDDARAGKLDPQLVELFATIV